MKQLQNKKKMREEQESALSSERSSRPNTVPQGTDYEDIFSIS